MMKRTTIHRFLTQLTTRPGMHAMARCYGHKVLGRLRAQRAVVAKSPLPQVVTASSADRAAAKAAMQALLASGAIDLDRLKSAQSDDFNIGPFNPDCSTSA
ncbi:hypothetical protein J9978_05945 [Chromobacterium violaceum]|uniref:hypothetical protein n=1 Tax=Chromobacterium violaceum TaxID=536 RepID=UPI001B334824|nr:hypothetical protein [Chromobacterium violaceum]MBP4049041.1 hypothetical protein [Chromobacterium violaceum]